MESWGLGLAFARLPLKRFYKYVLKRLIGGYLRHDIDLEQLEVQLYRGTVQLKALELDAAQLNLAAINSGFLIRFVSGLIGCIKMDIPWRHLLRDHCKVYVQGFNLTITRDVTSSLQGTSAHETAQMQPEDASRCSEELPSRYSDEGIETLSRLIKHVISRMEVCVDGATVSAMVPAAQCQLRAQLSSAVVFSQDGGEGVDARAVQMTGLALSLVPPPMEPSLRTGSDFQQPKTGAASCWSSCDVGSTASNNRGGEIILATTAEPTHMSPAAPGVLQIKRWECCGGGPEEGAPEAPPTGVKLDVDFKLPSVRLALGPDSLQALGACALALQATGGNDIPAPHSTSGNNEEDPLPSTPAGRDSPSMFHSLVESLLPGVPRSTGFWHELYNLFEADAQLADAAGNADEAPDGAWVAKDEEGLEEEEEEVSELDGHAPIASGLLSSYAIRINVSNIAGVYVLGTTTLLRPTAVPLRPSPTEFDADQVQICMETWSLAVSEDNGTPAISSGARCVQVYLHQCDSLPHRDDCAGSQDPKRQGDEVDIDPSLFSSAVSHQQQSMMMLQSAREGVGGLSLASEALEDCPTDSASVVESGASSLQSPVSSVSSMDDDALGELPSARQSIRSAPGAQDASRESLEAKFFDRSRSVAEILHCEEGEANAQCHRQMETAEGGWHSSSATFKTKCILQTVALQDNHGALAEPTGDKRWDPVFTLPSADHIVWDELQLVGDGSGAGLRVQSSLALMASKLAVQVEIQPIVVTLCAESIHMLSTLVGQFQASLAAPYMYKPRGKNGGPSTSSLPLAAAEMQFGLVGITPLLRVELELFPSSPSSGHRGCLGAEPTCVVIADFVSPRVFALPFARTSLEGVADNLMTPPSFHIGYAEQACVDLQDVAVYLKRDTSCAGVPAASTVTSQETLQVMSSQSVEAMWGSIRVFKQATGGLAPTTQEVPQSFIDATTRPAATERHVGGIAADWTKITVPSAGKDGRPAKNAAVLQDLRHASQRLLRPGHGGRIEMRRCSSSVPASAAHKQQQPQQPPPLGGPEACGAASDGVPPDVDGPTPSQKASDSSTAENPSCGRKVPRANSVDSSSRSVDDGRHGLGIAQECELEIDIRIPGMLSVKADPSILLLLQDSLSTFAGQLAKLSMASPAPRAGMPSGVDSAEQLVGYTLSLGSLCLKLTEEPNKDESAEVSSSRMASAGLPGDLHFRLATVCCRLMQPSRSLAQICCLSQYVGLESADPQKAVVEHLVRPWFKPFHDGVHRSVQAEGNQRQRHLSTQASHYPWEVREACHRSTVVPSMFLQAERGGWRDTHSVLLHLEQQRSGLADYITLSLKLNNLVVHVHPHLYKAYLRLWQFISATGTSSAHAAPQASSGVAVYKVSVLDCLVDVPSETCSQQLSSARGGVWESAQSMDNLELDKWRGIVHVDGVEVCIRILPAPALQSFNVSVGTCNIFLVDHIARLSKQDLLSSESRPRVLLVGRGFAHVMDLQGATATCFLQRPNPTGDADEAAGPTAAPPPPAIPDCGSPRFSSPSDKISSGHQGRLEVAVRSISMHFCSDTLKCLLCVSTELSELVPVAPHPSGMSPSDAAAPNRPPGGGELGVERKARAPQRESFNPAAGGGHGLPDVGILSNIDMFAFEPLPAAPSGATAQDLRPSPTAWRSSLSSSVMSPPIDSCLIDDYIRAQEKQQVLRSPVQAAVSSSLDGADDVDEDEEEEEDDYDDDDVDDTTLKTARRGGGKAIRFEEHDRQEAVIVSAGPPLRRNTEIDLLELPEAEIDTQSIVAAAWGVDIDLPDLPDMETLAAEEGSTPSASVEASQEAPATSTTSVALCLFHPEALPEEQLRELCREDRDARVGLERQYHQDPDEPEEPVGAMGSAVPAAHEAESGIRTKPLAPASASQERKLPPTATMRAAPAPLYQDGSAAVWFVDPSEVHVIQDHFVRWAEPQVEQKLQPPAHAPPVQLSITFHCDTANLSLHGGSDFGMGSFASRRNSTEQGVESNSPSVEESRSTRKQNMQLTLQLKNGVVRLMCFDTPTRSTSPIFTRLLVCAKEFCILDRVQGSVFSHLLASLEDDWRRPRPSHVDMLLLRVDAVAPPSLKHSESDVAGPASGALATRVPVDEAAPDAREYCVTLKVLPLRLTIDQDVVDFLLDFVQLCTLQTYVEEEAQDANPAASPQSPAEAARGSTTTPAAVPMSKATPFFQHVAVGALLVSVDYRAKRLDVNALRRGELWELVNLLPLLEGLEVALRAVQVGGVAGLSQVLAQVVEAWSADLNRTQILRSLTGVTPIRSFANIGGGFAELVLEPLKQYGAGGSSQSVSRTIQRGLVSFLRHMTVESIELTERIFVGTQSALEYMSDCLVDQGEASTSTAQGVPDAHGIPAEPPGRGEASLAQAWTPVERGAADFLQPGDAVEGLQQACTTLTRGMRHAGEAVVVRPLLEIKRGAPREKVLRSVVSGIPMFVLRPAIGATAAATTTLRGVRHSVDPMHRREIVRKYKSPE